MQMASTPSTSREDLRGVYSSPKTPTKKSFSKLRSQAKDTICSVCGISLIGDRCTFNVEHNSGLRAKLESVLEYAVDFKATSSRMCRPCGRKVEALEKKFNVVMQQVRELRGKFMSTRGKASLTVKRMSKASPSPKVHKKSRQLSSSKDQEDLGESFQPLPDDEEMDCSESTVLSCDSESSSARKRVRGQLFESEEEGSDVTLRAVDQGKETTPVTGQNEKSQPKNVPVRGQLFESEVEGSEVDQGKETALVTGQNEKSQPKKVPVRVVISYPSGEQKKEVHDEIAELVKYLGLGLFTTACKIVMGSPKLSEVIKGLVIKEMDGELEELCRKKSNSVLRQTKAPDLLEFQTEIFIKEIEEKTPLLNQALQSICCSNNKKRSTCNTPNPCVKATVAATILRERCPEMSAMAYRTGLVLRHAGAGGLGLELLCKMGLSCHPSTVASKLRELGQDHDKELLTWKKTSENEHEIKRCTEMLKSELDALSYLPELPSSAEFQAYAEELKQEGQTEPTTCTSSPPLLALDTAVQSSETTLDTSCLNLVCATEPQSTVHNVGAKLLDSGVSREGLIGSLERMARPPQSLDTLTEPTGYQIVGDNCDLHVNVRHMTNENKNKSFHWFNNVAFKDQVSGDHLPDVHESTLEDVPVSAFFPDNEDIQQLKRDFMALWSRVIVKHLPSFFFLRNAVIYHIPHQYSDAMKQPVPEVPLGLIAKNENKNEDMVDILDHLQSLYVPMAEKQTDGGSIEKVPVETVFFGGDQLTEERARNVQLARSDGTCTEERLDGVWPKNEDWHAIRIAYKAVIDILRKGNSVGDWGTYSSNAIISGNGNALGNVLGDDYNKIKEFFQTETDAFIVAATLNYFGMDKITDQPTKNCFPENLKSAGVVEKREWLHNQVCSMLEMFVMDSMVTLEEHSHLVTEFKCRDPECQKIYKYKKCRIRHEQKCHKLFVEDDEPSMSHEDEKGESEDHIFNYGCLHLSLGLLLRNAEDSVKEGDGDRLVRVWKFFTFLYRLKGATKYAIAALRLQASVLGLLTPKDAHRLKWNRFAGLKEGPGTRIARDLRLEQHNKVGKEEVRAMGLQNISNQSVEEVSKSEGAMEKIIHDVKNDYGIKKRKGHHSDKSKNATFVSILEQVHNKSATFKYTPGREHKEFPKFNRNIFQGINKKSTHRWIQKKKRKWHRQNRFLYKLN